VNNPGLIHYVPGENFHYYIQKAGGYSWNARKGMLRLIKAHSGTWMKPKKSTPIEIGDTIFVPEKQEVDWWELSKDLLLVASQVATVLIMIKSL
jgi:protein involved in polysaccharide export with SLBB domain